MVLLGTIDFTDKEEMYNDLKRKTLGTSKLKNFMIFDDESHKVWIIWWEV